MIQMYETFSTGIYGTVGVRSTSFNAVIGEGGSQGFK